MNYEKIYNQITERAKIRILEGYRERHHIIPKCMGGANDANNLVELTAREHFLCHRLLCEIYPDNHKLWYALWAMTVLKGEKQYRYIPSARVYESIKIKLSLIRSQNNLGRKMSEECIKKRVESRKGYKHSEATRTKISEANMGKVRSMEFKYNLSIMHKGKAAHNKNKPTPEHIKEKISNTMKLRKNIPWNKGLSTKILTCPYCNKLVDPGNAKQWHFEKCKQISHNKSNLT